MLRLVTVCRPAEAFIFYSGHPDVCTSIIKKHLVICSCILGCEIGSCFGFPLQNYNKKETTCIHTCLDTIKAVSKVAFVASAVEWPTMISAAGGLMTLIQITALIQICSKWKKILIRRKLKQSTKHIKGALLLLKSKSGFLIRKRIIYPSNPQRRWILYVDHTQNRILWIHDPKRFFTTDSKRVKYCQ